jgi:hypothetical protein
MLREKNVNFAAPDQDFWYSRLFSDANHLLSVTYDRQKGIVRFHFIDGMDSDVKKGLSWSIESGLRYSAIDSGESSPLANRSPLVTANLKVNAQTLWKHFSELATDIDPEVTAFIKSKIFQPASPKPARTRET